MPEDYGEAFDFKRVPMTEKPISDISENDIRVAVLGTVVDRDGDMLVVDDGDDSIEVVLTEETDAETQQLVRVIGRVRSNDELHIEAEAIQDMEGLDVDMYRELKKRLET